MAERSRCSQYTFRTRPKKKSKTTPELQGEDRISSLPDELIHKIYSFLDAKEALQSSVLSKRWKLIWTTLPCLSFGRYGSLLFGDISRYTMLIRHFLSNRNHQSNLSKLKIYVPQKLTVKQSVCRKKFRGCVLEKFIQYAISHNVQELDIRFSRNFRRKLYKLSTFSSNSMRTLKLDLFLGEDFVLDLPALTTLHLKDPYRSNNRLESLLTSLPALRTLCLGSSDLSEMSFSLPNLTTLRLNGCSLPQRVWDLPALLSLHLESVTLPENMSDMLSNLVNLKHLTLILMWEFMPRDHFISCPQLLNLNIRADSYRDCPYGKIVVSAPQLCNFSSFGIFSINVEAPELENVNIKLKDWFKYDKKTYYQPFTRMLSGLGTAKNLSFDLESIEALSEIINVQASISSPFINLKYLKLPKEYRESSLSSALRSYLLGGCPRATIVTSVAQNNRIHHTRAVSVAPENMVLQEPLAAPTKEPGDFRYKNRTVMVDTVDMGVEEQHVMENSLVDANKAGQTDPLVGGLSNDWVSSFKGSRDFGLWQGHEVNSDFVCLLDRIMHKYPETFEHFTTKNKKLCTMNLNMLCTSLNDFTKISMTEVSSEMIVEYRDVFAYLKNQGFDVGWLVNRLNYIEQLRFSKPLIPELHAIDSDINDAKSKLQDLQALRKAKMTEIQNAFGTPGTRLAAGSIGDDLLSGP